MVLLNRLLPGALGMCCACVAGMTAAQTLHQRPAPSAAPPVRQEPAAKPVAPEYILPAGTSLQVETDRTYPMKAGETIQGRLVYPLFLNGELAVPAQTVVTGRVLSLAANKKERLHARLMGDFTPFHTARVEFSSITLDGSPMALRTHGAVTGAPVLRLSATGEKAHRNLIKREWASGMAMLHSQIAFFKAPGFGERAKQMLYHQLPYHPENIPVHTAWTFELSQPFKLPHAPAEAAAATPPAPAPGNPEIWSVHALLNAEVTSATAKAGDPVKALVVEPVYDRNRDLVVPQGSTLVGHVTMAKSARSLGRNGKLRFTFQQIRFPSGVGTPTPDRNVQGSLGGATTEGANGLSMDAEGTVTPKSKASAVAPLLLTMLAGRALDTDGNMVAGTTVASNGFGIIGRVVGIAAGSRNIAAGIGFYAAALSTYDNFLRPGHDVDFPKDTRIEIETTPLRAPVLKPQVSGQ
ncbi:MAG: hypothetical protein ACLGSD_05170 [Acidobacteriota bacterium]